MQKYYWLTSKFKYALFILRKIDSCFLAVIANNLKPVVVIYT